MLFAQLCCSCSESMTALECFHWSNFVILKETDTYRDLDKSQNLVKLLHKKSIKLN